MPIQNLVTGSFSEEASKQVIEHLMAAKALMPFLITLTPDEKQSLTKVADGRIGLLEKGYGALTGHAEVLPPYIPVEDLKTRRNLLQNLSPIATLVSEINCSLHDTTVAGQSDNLNIVLDGYESIKRIKDRVPGLTVAYDMLSAYFYRPSRKSKADGEDTGKTDAKSKKKSNSKPDAKAEAPSTPQA